MAVFNSSKKLKTYTFWIIFLLLLHYINNYSLIKIHIQYLFPFISLPYICVSCVSKWRETNTMESKPLCWILLSLLILSCFVSQTHEKMQEQNLAYLHNSILKKSSGFDTSFFEAIDNFNETNVHPQEGLKERDRIERLPGQDQVNFSQYGGYVTVDKSAGRALYYYFVEAQHSKDSLPLLLWLNGGIQYYTWSYLSLQLMSLSNGGNTCN